MNPCTKILILATESGESCHPPPGDAACAVVVVDASLLYRCRRRIATAEAAYALDPALAQLRFRDVEAPSIYGDDLLEACARLSDEFHDDFVNNNSALLPDGVPLAEFPETPIASRGLIVWPDQLASKARWNISFTALTEEGGTRVRPTTIPFDYLVQLLGDNPEPCDCESSGIPGIIAHLQNNRLVPGQKVQRCDLCERYPSDAAALEELRRRGIA